jgi:hypothetical protein
LSGILDMRKGKHTLHCLDNDELLPFAVVNIPDNEKIHFGVFYFIFFIYFFISLFIYLYFIIFIYY